MHECDINVRRIWPIWSHAQRIWQISKTCGIWPNAQRLAKCLHIWSNVQRVWSMQNTKIQTRCRGRTIHTILQLPNSTLWFLNRNTGHCSRNVKQYCYETYVRPQLEYASTVWSSYTNANIDKLEMVQQNAARYVFQEFGRYSSPTAMIKQLEWMTLEQIRHDVPNTVWTYRCFIWPHNKVS